MDTLYREREREREVDLLYVMVISGPRFDRRWIPRVIRPSVFNQFWTMDRVIRGRRQGERRTSQQIGWSVKFRFIEISLDSGNDNARFFEERWIIVVARSDQYNWGAIVSTTLWGENETFFSFHLKALDFTSFVRGSSLF